MRPKLAETWFFETLVRIHRAGEGAPCGGLKPAGHIAEPAHRLKGRLKPSDLVDAPASHLG